MAGAAASPSRAAMLSPLPVAG